MAETFPVTCPRCAALFDLPLALRPSVAGRELACAGCGCRFRPLEGGAPGGAPPLRLDLRAYQRAGPPALHATVRGPLPEGVAARPSLRVVAEGPGLARRAVFDLGDERFLIGRSGGDLNLPEADIPAPALAVRLADDAFQLEGLNGFAIPLGPLRVAAGRLEPGAELVLALGPYRVVLEGTTTPGEKLARVAGRPADRAAEDAAAGGEAGAPIEGLRVALLGTSGRFQGASLAVTRTPAVIGRSDAADLVIDDAAVSTRHARLLVRGEGDYRLEDLASTNSTTVNGRPVAASALAHGDFVSFGGVEFRFYAKAV